MATLPKIIIKPLGDRVAVLPVEAEQITKSGIHIPDTAKGEKPQIGTVFSLGSGHILNDDGKEATDPNDLLSIGDKVIFYRFGGHEVKMKDEKGKEHDVKILRLHEILGVIS